MLRPFPLGLLAPYLTWLRVESRAGCRSHIFFIEHYFLWTSRSAAIFRTRVPPFLL